MERDSWLKIYNILLSNGYLMNNLGKKALELDYDKMILSYPLGDKKRVGDKASHTYRGITQDEPLGSASFLVLIDPCKKSGIARPTDSIAITSIDLPLLYLL